MTRLGLRISDLIGMDVKGKVDLADECQLKAIELSASELIDHKETILWKNYTQSKGIEITTAGIGISLCDPDQKEEVIEKTKKIIEGANLLGGISLFSRTMIAPEGIPQHVTWDYLSEFTYEITELCQKGNIKFAIEIDHAPCFVHTLERFEKLYNTVNHDNLYVNFDPTNLYVNGSDPITAIEKWSHRFIGAHFKDGIYQTKNKSEVPIGEGEVPYEKIFKKLAERNLSLTFQLEHIQDAERVKDAVRKVRNLYPDVG
ncbi:sugar phosphate isomerase/epimerase family protein [Niallia sp. 03133]|uniref:sugar phosphate isomerase/epimerase family protein n=1 Tax=Niallia sp. 03133 TaxID=3458060 RepID=UPI00404511B9